MEKAIQTNVDFKTSYLDIELKNPIVLAPGHLSSHSKQIEEAAKSGFGAIVLKSVVGEDKKGNASMEINRRTSKFWWVKDEEGNPILHWKGGLDLRSFPKYLEFAREAYKIGQDYNTPLIASFLCHLPRTLDEEWKVKEWEYTTRKLNEIGYTHMEIDFCPFLKEDEEATNKMETVLRWYREAPGLIKEVDKKIKVVPKILNLDFDMEFQEKMVRAAVEGGADGVTIANRFFVKGYVNKETGEVYDTAHGGKELRERNQELIRKVRKGGIRIPINATGGTYTGEHVLEYLSLGAQDVQVFTYVFNTKVEKKKKIGEALQNLLLNPQNGLVTTMLSKGIYSLDQLDKL